MYSKMLESIVPSCVSHQYVAEVMALMDKSPFFQGKVNNFMAYLRQVAIERPNVMMRIYIAGAAPIKAANVEEPEKPSQTQLNSHWGLAPPRAASPPRDDARRPPRNTSPPRGNRDRERANARRERSPTRRDEREVDRDRDRDRQVGDRDRDRDRQVGDEHGGASRYRSPYVDIKMLTKARNPGWSLLRQSQIRCFNCDATEHTFDCPKVKDTMLFYENANRFKALG